MATPRPGAPATTELRVEEVAERLGLPVAMLLRRIEAGDVPARRVETSEGIEYRLNLDDLGTGTVPATPIAADAPPEDSVPDRGTGPADPGVSRASVELRPAEPVADPRTELALMAIDPHELVAGLLDRWERTLEQRIHAEQRQRFQSELDARQAQVKQLQVELDAAHVQHAAQIAEREWRLAEQQRLLEERERQLAEARDAAGRRRSFFRR